MPDDEKPDPARVGDAPATPHARTAASPRRRASDRIGAFLRTDRRRHVAAFALYLLASFVLFGIHVLPHLRSRMVGTGSPDSDVFVWAMRWWPWAIGHGANPFLSHVVWAPTGYNLAWSTTVPVAAIVVAPVTLAFGPVVSFNVLSLLAPALAAFTAYVLCMRITKAFWPSVAGGFIYGFSAYLTNTLAAGHLDLSLVFLPPLAVYLVVRRVEGSLSPRAFVLLLGLVLALQIGLFQEVFATMTVVGAFAGLVAVALKPRAWRVAVRTAGLVALAYILALVAASPILYAMVAYARPIKALPDLSNLARVARDWTQAAQLVVPGSATAIGRGWVRLGDQAIGSNGSYLGLPLVAIVVALVVTRRRERLVWVVGAVFVAAALFSLGPALRVGGVVLPLPWRAVDVLPLYRHALPGRVMNYAFLAGAVAVAMWTRTGGRLRWAVTALALAATLPSLSASRWGTPVDLPAFLATGAYRSVVPPDATVFVIAPDKGTQMLWQADAGNAFRLATGYLGGVPPDYRGKGVQRLLSERKVPAAGPLRAYLVAHDIRAFVILGPAPTMIEGLAAQLGTTPRREGAVTVIVVPPASAYEPAPGA